MHMADALISPAAGGAMWAATAGLIVYSAKKLKREGDDRKAPLMGVLGAFIFASQMINFSIPGTGSSGHLGGGMILSILLGPYAAFLVMASILTVQAFFFADGGLLALGCNIFNMGFFPCFLAYPLIYRKIVGGSPTQGNILTASVVSAVVGLQLGALGVVLETVSSGIAALPFAKFVLLMQPIHLAIGIAEGLVTAAVVSFVWKARPEALGGRLEARVSLRRIIVGFAMAAAVIGGVLSWFASADPDGLEWAMAKTSGQKEIAAPAGIREALAGLQEKVAFLPDYSFKAGDTASQEASVSAWPAVDPGTSLSGIVGGFLTLALACLIGFVLRARRVGASKV